MKSRSILMRHGLLLVGLLLALLCTGCDRRTDPKPFCGDGVIDPEESCDGTDLGGHSCESLGFVLGGVLTCTEDCELNVAGCFGARCGDGVRGPGEECDQGDLGGATCTSLGYYEGGELSCTADCTLDRSGCEGGYCGDEIINGPEMCDGEDMSAVTCVATCQDYGYYGGELSCATNCTLDPSTCVGRCGDEIKNGPEVCDGSDLGEVTCLSLGYHGGGELACGEDCMTLYDGGCEGGYCGDGEVNGDEDCDNLDLGDMTCIDLGYLGGELACTEGCTYDLTLCQEGHCGDGIRSGAEACDGTDLGGATCASLGYYEGGELACTDGCAFEVTGCMGGYCGDGIRNGPEVCDGADLGGAICEDFGFIDGTLGCSAACELDTSACILDWSCGEILVDDRDGKTYATLAMGGLCWMATNLDVGLRIDIGQAQANDGVIEKYCYSNDLTMCEDFGGLYQWNEAMQYTVAAGARGICPERWRLPTDQEWKDLEIAAGMDPQVADEDQWRGPPAGTVLQVGGSSGFDALLGGMITSSGYSYNYPAYGYYWTSTLSYSMPWRRCLTSGPAYSPETIGRWDTWPQGYALSIRCVADL